MNKPLISVIIPSYNRANLIIEAVNSILSQTYSNIELIVIDDCSTDNTKSLLQNIKDKRFKYFCLERNSGACVARNKGIQESSGDFIAFNDSDDKWHINKLEEQLNFLHKNSADIVLCSMKCCDSNNNYLHDFPNNKIQEGRISYLDLLFYNCSSTQTLFGKSSCFKEINFDSSMPRLQDWDEVLRLSKKYKIYYQNKILVDTFIQKDSISTHPEKGVIAMNKLFEKHHDAITSSKSILRSFYKKKASFVCKTGVNPTEEMLIILKSYPNIKNFIAFILAKVGIYKFLFNLKKKF